MSFPLLMIHAGDCGYVAAISFKTEDVYDSNAWIKKAEDLRKIAQQLNDEYIIRWPGGGIFNDKRGG